MSASGRRGFTSPRAAGNSARRTRCCGRSWRNFLDLPAITWRFTADDSGKPWIDPATGGRAMPFSLSHIRGLMAAAVAAQGMNGVNVERVDPGEADRAVAEIATSRPPGRRARLLSHAILPAEL
jgi:phosphopantetheinyl transferase